jgi:thiamine-monophosphate kinase
MDERVTEFGLIKLLASLAGDSRTSSSRVRTGIGDDAAVGVPGGATATSVDSLVDGVHFRRAWCPPESIADKAVAAALSDLAAMAAQPGEIYVALGLPPGLEAGYAEELAHGFTAAAGRFDTVLAGGDIVSSATLFVSVTVVGHAEREDGFLLRAGAGAGELVAVTGALGGASAALCLLEDPTLILNDAGLRRALLERQLSPRPQIEAGRRLALAGATAMIDVSDGLAADLAHVAASSSVLIQIEADQVPVQPGVPEVAKIAGRQATGMVLGGGEDFELAVTLAPGDLASAVSALAEIGVSLTPIGRVCEGEGVIAFEGGAELQLSPGYEHLA